jgi:metal-responsive CopG/Arc/MetJ family transcriptional regulator
MKKKQPAVTISVSIRHETAEKLDKVLADMPGWRRSYAVDLAIATFCEQILKGGK